MLAKNFIFFSSFKKVLPWCICLNCFDFGLLVLKFQVDVFLKMSQLVISINLTIWFSINQQIIQIIHSLIFSILSLYLYYIFFFYLFPLFLFFFDPSFESGHSWEFILLPLLILSLFLLVVAWFYNIVTVHFQLYQIMCLGRTF